MGLPSDIAERVRLAEDAIRHRPKELTEPRNAVSAVTEEALRRVVTNIRRREHSGELEMAQATDRVDARLEAVKRAREEFCALWEEFVRHVNSLVAWELDPRSDHRDDSWSLILGDRRLVVNIAIPPTHTGAAILLGTISVETEDSDRYKSHVANVCAIRDTSGAPVWQLVRFQRNDMARQSVNVSESLSDGQGAVDLNALDRLVDLGTFGGGREETQPDFYPEATMSERVGLDVDCLLRVLVAELAALDERAQSAGVIRGDDRT